MRLDGLVAAAFTPFNDDCSLALDRVGPLMEYYLSRPLAGLFVCGTAGECSALTDDERRTVVDAFVRAAAGRLPIIVHVGSSSVASARALAAHAASVGVAGIAATSPYYVRPATAELLVDSAACIAAGAPTVPFYHYHIPVCTGVSMPVAPTIPRLIERIPSFAGFKYTYEDLSDYSLAIEACGPERQAFYGREEALLPALSLGATGSVGNTYNYSARVYDALITAFRRNDLPAARRWQVLGQKQVGIMSRYGGMGASKAVMGLAGIDVGPCRLPAARLSPAEMERYADELKTLGFTQWL